MNDTPSRVSMFVLAAVALAGVVPAQRTWVVDAAGGAGSQFRAIAPAIAIASPGDTVLVRAGAYPETLDIDAGIRLVGQGARIQAPSLPVTTVMIRDIPRGQSFAMTGFAADSSSGRGVAVMRVERCRGSVAVSGFGQTNFVQWSLAVINSTHVHAGGGVLRVASVTGSTVVLERLSFDPELLAGMTIEAGDVHCTRCTIRGSFGTFPGSGVMLRSGRFAATRCSIEGTGAGAFAQPAIDSLGGEIVLDPSTTLRSAHVPGPIRGPATVVTRELPSLTAYSTGTSLMLEIHGRANAGHVTVLSLPGVHAPSPFGELWVDPSDSLFVAAGVLPATRLDTLAAPHAPLPAGFHVTLQSAHVDSTFQVSPPTTWTF